MPTWFLVLFFLSIVAIFVVAPVAYEYYSEWKESKKNDSGKR